MPHNRMRQSAGVSPSSKQAESPFAPRVRSIAHIISLYNPPQWSPGPIEIVQYRRPAMSLLVEQYEIESAMKISNMLWNFGR